VLYSLLGTQIVAIGGVKTLLIAPFATGQFSYADANCSTINSAQGFSGWERFECSDESEFGEQYALTKQGDQYAQAVGLLIPALSAEKRSVLQALLQTGPVVCLLLDFNGTWWLYGQTRGLRVLKFAFKGGSFRNATNVGFTLEGTQDDAARAVNKTFVNLIHNSASTPTTPQDGVPATPAPTPFRGFAYLLPARLGQF
jgi:hypothetical protein